MRNLTTAALAKINEFTRVESIILVNIYWNGSNTPTIYSDKEYQYLGTEGKLINIGALDDVVAIDNSSNSASVAVTLDDTDGILKRLIDINDIHKTKVEIKQMFADLGTGDAFRLFIGEIFSPIVWNEGDRTLSFEVITRLLDIEVGFSAEDGGLLLTPAASIGKAWPMIFGTVGGVQALQFIGEPTGILGEAVGVVNELAWTKELKDLNDQLLLAKQHALDSLVKADQADKRAVDLGWPGSDVDGDGFDDALGYPLEPGEQAHNQGTQYHNQADQYLEEINKILTQLGLRLKQKGEQEVYNKTTFTILSHDIPEDVPLEFRIGSLIFTGRLNAGIFHADEITLPELINGQTVFTDIGRRNTISVAFAYFGFKNVTESSQKFYWIDAGTEIRIINFPITYVASINFVQITAVYGFKNGVRTLLPPSYYTVEYATYDDITTSTGPIPLNVTFIILKSSLSSIVDLSNSVTWDNDNIEFDAVSPIGPNVIDEMIYLINTFTSFSYDPISFAHVKDLLTNYPANFALTTRKNIVEFLKEMAYQARCSIRIDDGIFYISYLPERPTPVETITDDDVIVNTFSITTTATEKIITKYTAQWRALHNQKDPYEIIYKYNTIKYGVNEQVYNYYMYNSSDIVEVVSQFWLIRTSNVYKILKFKTAINKLKLETLDAVNIILPSACNDPVIGIVQKAAYNPVEFTIDFEVWVPVRFGEMTEYKFAYPKDLDETHIYPDLVDPNIKTANPFTNLLLDFIPARLWAQTPLISRGIRVQDGPLNTGRNQPIGDAHDKVDHSPAPNIQTVLDPRDIDPSKPDSLPQANEKSTWDVQPPQSFDLPAQQPGSWPGTVIESIDNLTYKVQVYFNGLKNRPTTVQVQQFQLRDDDTIPNLTPVMVTRIVTKAGIEYVMQAPVFADNQDEGP